ncbi:SagB/ThcOx family dehydrogenase [Sphaerimonospora thailandensis]|nr:SagB/ThcOx family dehydrogenase [Sphaerimonospora thailandensis]
MTRVRVSRLVFFHWRNGQMVCDDPLRHRQFALSAAAESLLRPLSHWTDLRELDGELSELAQRLLAAHVLVAEGSPEHLLEERESPWSTWGSAATYYHLATRTRRDDAFLTAAEDTAEIRRRATARPSPSPFKTHGGQVVRLPEGGSPDGADFGADFGHVLRARRTTRRFSAADPVSAEQLSGLLRWVAGPFHRIDVPGVGSVVLKTSPSGGARHAIEVYPVVLSVSGVPPGVYHYRAQDHCLETVRPGRPDSGELVHWCGGQLYADTAGVLLLYTAVLRRSAWKYRTGRTYRTLFMDLGHLSQTAYLVATALGLGAFFTAATRDEAIEEVLGLTWEEEIFLGLTGVGVPDETESRRQREMLAGGPAGFSFAMDAWDGLGTT